MRQLSPVFALSLHIGCVTSTVTSVRVRDPSEVSLQPRGAPARTEIIPAGAGTRTAVAGTGPYLGWVTEKPVGNLAPPATSPPPPLPLHSSPTPHSPPPNPH